MLEVRFREGDDIKAGETAAILGGEDVRAQLRVAEANLLQTRESAWESRAGLQSASSEQQLAVTTFRRTEDLLIILIGVIFFVTAQLRFRKSVA